MPWLEVSLTSQWLTWRTKNPWVWVSLTKEEQPGKGAVFPPLIRRCFSIDCQSYPVTAGQLGSSTQRWGQGEQAAEGPWALHHLNTALQERSGPELQSPWDHSNSRAQRNHFPGRCIAGSMETQVTLFSSGPSFLRIYTGWLLTKEGNLITGGITYR